MKNILKINIFLVAILGLSMVFTNCKKDDFDVPPTIIPSFTLPEGDTLLTIAELKAMPVSNPLVPITNRYWIQGVITGNDESGNIYKSMYIQDGTAGIVLSLNKKEMYLKYKRGQQIFVKLTDLYVGLYGGTPQVGGLYNGSIGQLPELQIPNHLFINGLPGAIPAPKMINGAADLTIDKVQSLVQLDSVAFVEVGQPYATSTATTNRNMTLKDGSNITVRTSNYSLFKDSLLPAGRGNVIAILGQFSGTYQLTIRDLNDVKGFSTTK